MKGNGRKPFRAAIIAVASMLLSALTSSAGQGTTASSSTLPRMAKRITATTRRVRQLTPSPRATPRPTTPSLRDTLLREGNLGSTLSATPPPLPRMGASASAAAMLRKGLTGATKRARGTTPSLRDTPPREGNYLPTPSLTRHPSTEGNFFFGSTASVVGSLSFVAKITPSLHDTLPDENLSAALPREGNSSARSAATSALLQFAPDDSFMPSTSFLPPLPEVIPLKQKVSQLVASASSLAASSYLRVRSFFVDAPSSQLMLRCGVARSGAAPETRAMLANREGHRPARVAVLSAATTVGLSLLGTFGTPAVALAEPIAQPPTQSETAVVAYQPMHVEIRSAATALRLQSATHALPQHLLDVGVAA